MNTKLLKCKLRELSLTQADAAEKMGVSLSQFNAKVNERDGAEFSLGELKALRALLSLTCREVDQIFLG